MNMNAEIEMNGVPFAVICILCISTRSMLNTIRFNDMNK